MQKPKEKIATWNIQVPKPLDKAVDKLITQTFHMTKAEFIREAVREKLEKHGVKP
jgi:metal-responsive CopG/Arc/MetJ family transcriptional regulator